MRAFVMFLLVLGAGLSGSRASLAATQDPLPPGLCRQSRATVCEEKASAGCREVVSTVCADSRGVVTKSVQDPNEPDFSGRSMLHSPDNKTHTYCDGFNPQSDISVIEVYLYDRLSYLKAPASSSWRNFRTNTGFNVQWRKGNGNRCYGWKYRSSSVQTSEAATDMVLYDGVNLQDASNPCEQQSRGTLGVTNSIYLASSGVIHGSTICVDGGAVSAYARVHKIDREHLIAFTWCHEMGHSLGLEHVDNGLDTCMQAYTPDGPGNDDMWNTYRENEMAELRGVANGRER